MFLDPDICERCKERGSVYNSRRFGLGYRFRQHRCACGHKWESWQTRERPEGFIQRWPIKKRPQDVGRAD